MFKKLFKSAGVYVFSSVLNAAIPFLLIPIYTRTMSTEEYGLLSMFQLVILLLGPITGLSIHGAITRQYYEKDKIDLPNYIGNALLILVSSSLLIGLIIYLTDDLLFSLTGLNKFWLYLTLMVAVAQFLNQVVLVLYQVQFKPLKYGLFLISQTIVNAGLSIVLVVSFKMGWQGAAYGQSFSFISFGLLSIFLLMKGSFIKPKIHMPYVKHAFFFGLPLVPVALGIVLMNMIDRLFLKKMVGIEAVGVYTVGYQIAMILYIFVNSFNKAWVPWLFERLKLERIQEKVKIVKFTYVYFAGLIIFAALLGISAPYLIKFYVSEEFYGASQYVIWLGFGYAFNGMYKMMTNYVHFAERTSLNFIVMLIAVPLNVLFNYVFIKANGPIGAAHANALSSFFTFIFMWILSAKVYNMPWFSFLGKKAQESN